MKVLSGAHQICLSMCHHDEQHQAALLQARIQELEAQTRAQQATIAELHATLEKERAILRHFQALWFGERGTW